MLGGPGGPGRPSKGAAGALAAAEAAEEGGPLPGAGEPEMVAVGSGTSGLAWSGLFLQSH